MTDEHSSRPPGMRDEGAGEPPVEERERRTRLERFGMAAIAVVMAGLFATVAAAAFAGHEYILAAMSLVGAMMTLAVGGITLLRG